MGVVDHTSSFRSSLVHGAFRIHVSEWRAANICADGEIIFAVGDVHGCAALLSTLLDACGHLHNRDVRPRRLVFLGDVINRGPATIEALRRWAQESPIQGITLVDRLMGNHEQLLRLTTQAGDGAEMAGRALLKCGGDRLLQELRQTTRMPNAELKMSFCRCRRTGCR
jgi:serine/threonine protein phosphatase 1